MNQLSYYYTYHTNPVWNKLGKLKKYWLKHHIKPMPNHASPFTQAKLYHYPKTRDTVPLFKNRLTNGFFGSASLGSECRRNFRLTSAVEKTAPVCLTLGLSGDSGAAEGVETTGVTRIAGTQGPAVHPTLTSHWSA